LAAHETVEAADISLRHADAVPSQQEVTQDVIFVPDPGIGI
jgi:hypothetical protein